MAKFQRFQAPRQVWVMWGLLVAAFPYTSFFAMMSVISGAPGSDRNMPMLAFVFYWNFVALPFVFLIAFVATIPLVLKQRYRVAWMVALVPVLNLLLLLAMLA